MKIAYLILAHANPRHLQRLLKALRSANAGSFVHVDAKSPLADFSDALSGDVVATTQRVPVYWGDFSQIEAILVLVRAALADPRRFDRLVLLSGADYPLRSATAIESFFQQHPDAEFLNRVALPNEPLNKPLSRLTRYEPRVGDPALKKLLIRFLRKAGIIRSRDYRLALGDLKPFAGSEWWALTRAAAEHVVAFADRERKVMAFFEHTVVPDESVIQTILGNSGFSAKIRRNLTYTDWLPGAPSPARMTATHLPLFRSGQGFPEGVSYGGGEMLFARKFGDDDEALVEAMDALIAEREAAT
jgi:hypothetical protein